MNSIDQSNRNDPKIDLILDSFENQHQISTKNDDQTMKIFQNQSCIFNEVQNLPSIDVNNKYEGLCFVNSSDITLLENIFLEIDR